jgi:hypothetical protein
MGNLLGTIKVGTLVKREDIQSARSRPKRALTASRPLPALDDIDDDLLPFALVRVIAGLTCAHMRNSRPRRTT